MGGDTPTCRRVGPPHGQVHTGALQADGKSSQTKSKEHREQTGAKRGDVKVT